MKLSDIVSLGDGLYELEKGLGDRRLPQGGYAKLLFGSIQTVSNPQVRSEEEDGW